MGGVHLGRAAQNSSAISRGELFVPHCCRCVELQVPLGRDFTEYRSPFSLWVPFSACAQLIHVVSWECAGRFNCTYMCAFTHELAQMPVSLLEVNFSCHIAGTLGSRLHGALSCVLRGAVSPPKCSVP